MSIPFQFLFQSSFAHFAFFSSFSTQTYSSRIKNYLQFGTIAGRILSIVRFYETLPFYERFCETRRDCVSYEI